MIVTSSRHPRFLSNCFLVADQEGGSAVFIDAGGPIEPLLAEVQRLGVKVTHLLNTHEHADHTAHNVALQERYDIPLLTPDELADGDRLDTGELHIRALSTPGHVPGHLAFVVNDECVFTGDVLFKGSVGGTLNGGPAGFEELRRSVMDVLLTLDHEMVVHPGHSEPTTIGEEWSTNPFVRVWRGLADEGDEPVLAAGHKATLVLWGPDYDGGNKAWVRFEDGHEAIVGGSQVERVGVRG